MTRRTTGYALALAACATASAASAQYTQQGAPPPAAPAPTMIGGPQPYYPPPMEPPQVVGYGPSLSLRVGGGFDLESGGFNLFGLGFGLSFEYAPENMAFFIGVDGTYFIGEGVDGPGPSHPSQIFQALGWAGYNGVLSDSFVMRASLGLGLEQWWFNTGGFDVSDLGIAFGAQIEFQYYLDQQLHLTLTGRYTGGWHGGSESLDGVAAFVGAGYAF